MDAIQICTGYGYTCGRGLVDRWYIERDSTVVMELAQWLRREIRRSNKIKPWEVCAKIFGVTRFSGTKTLVRR